jgi:hypothetical protein
MTTKLETKATLEQRIRGLIAGTQKHPPTGSLTVDGASYTAAALVQLLQSLADALSAVDAARALWQNALTKQRAVQTQVLPVIRGYSSLLLAANGNAPATLADYGLTPRKATTPLSTEARAAAIAKSTATREARHTMGTKQKKLVKGTVPTSPATPQAPTATATTTPTPTPAAKPST